MNYSASQIIESSSSSDESHEQSGSPLLGRRTSFLPPSAAASASRLARKRLLSRTSRPHPRRRILDAILEPDENAVEDDPSDTPPSQTQTGKTQPSPGCSQQIDTDEDEGEEEETNVYHTPGTLAGGEASCRSLIDSVLVQEDLPLSSPSISSIESGLDRTGALFSPGRVLSQAEMDGLEDYLASNKKRQPVKGGHVWQLERLLRVEASRRVLAHHQLALAREAAATSTPVRPSNELRLRITSLQIVSGIVSLQGVDPSGKERRVMLSLELCPPCLPGVGELVGLSPPWTLVGDVILGLTAIATINMEKDIQQGRNVALESGSGDMMTISLTRPHQRVFSLQPSKPLQDKDLHALPTGDARARNREFIHSSRRWQQWAVPVEGCPEVRLSCWAPAVPARTVQELLAFFGGFISSPPPAGGASAARQSCPDIVLLVVQPLISALSSRLTGPGVGRQVEQGLLGEDAAGRLVLVRFDKNLPVSTHHQPPPLLAGGLQWYQLVGRKVKLSGAYPRTRYSVKASSKLFHLASGVKERGQSLVYQLQLCATSRLVVVEDSVSSPCLIPLRQLAHTSEKRFSLKCYLVHADEDDRKAMLLDFSSSGEDDEIVAARVTEEAVLPQPPFPLQVHVFGLLKDGEGKLVMDHYTALIPLPDDVADTCLPHIPRHQPNSPVGSIVRIVGKLERVVKEESAEWSFCSWCRGQDILQLAVDSFYCQHCKDYVTLSVRLSMVVDVGGVLVELLHHSTLDLLGDKEEWNRKAEEVLGLPMDLVCMVKLPHCKQIHWRH